MRLVEIVVGLDTDADIVEQAATFAEQIGKHPIRTKDRSGFIVNMLLVPYLMAAVRMYEEGFASREDIDDGMKLGAGHPMGPLTLCDFIGLDVLCAVCDSLYDEFKRPEYAPPPLLKRMVASGHHGRKTGCGFYDYAEAEAKAGAVARDLQGYSVVSFRKYGDPRGSPAAAGKDAGPKGVALAHRGPRTLPDVVRGPLECRRICERGHSAIGLDEV